MMKSLALAIALVASPALAADSKPPCDRACLTTIAGRYMDALVAKAPNGLPWAQTVHFSENSVPMMIGDGLWGSISGHGTKPLVAADPATGNVAWIGTVEEHGQPAFYAMRLKVEGGRISEVETVVRRKEGHPPFGDPASFAPAPLYGDRLPEKARSPQARMIALVEGYYNGLAGNDGTLFTRFDPACVRTENGVVETSGESGPAAFAQGCEAQFRLGLFRAVDRVRARRLPIVDVERGIVVAIGYRDYSARIQNFVTTDGRPYKAPTVYPQSQGFLAVFRIADGRIQRIDDYASELSYLIPSPWKE